MTRPLNITFFFSHAYQHLEDEVLAGKSPKERLYGVYELRELGHKVNVRDERFFGLSGVILQKLKSRGLNLITFSDALAIYKSDLVYTKDSFSLLMGLACLIFNKRLVYCDAMFYIPKNPLKKLLTKINILLADKIICYSHSQKAEWDDVFKIPKHKIECHNYVIDYDFYGRDLPNKTESKKLRGIAIGRDPGREYATLISACSKATDMLSTTLIAPSYLIPADQLPENVTHIPHVSYEELFTIYAAADVAIVPLKKNIFYPSGIRAVLEAIAKQKLVIATKTNFLSEIFTDRKDILFFDAESESSLLEAISFANIEKEAAEQIRKHSTLILKEKFSYLENTNILIKSIIGTNNND